MNKSDWVWMPHAAHFICGHECRFRLATFIPGTFTWPAPDYDESDQSPVESVGVIVSTVGEYVPDQRVRRIHAEVRGVEIPGRGDEWDANFQERFGFMDIGAGRKYETMVFPAAPAEGDMCCPFRAVHRGGERDAEPYNDAEAAFRGHTAMCEKWAAKLDEMVPFAEQVA